MLDNNRLGELLVELKEFDLDLQKIQLEGVQKTERVRNLLHRGRKYPLEEVTVDEMIDLWFIMGYSDRKISEFFNVKHSQVTKKREELGVTDDTALLLLLERILQEKRDSVTDC